VSPDEELSRALDLGQRRFVFLVGSGGKTSLLFELARCALRAGRRVITTTSTRILRPGAESGAMTRLLSEEDPEDGALGRLIESLRAHPVPHVTLARGVRDGKLIGCSSAELELLFQARVADLVIVEADGAAGKPLKAWAPYEPVVSPLADLVVAVVGADAVGAPLDETHVHRSALLASWLGLEPGTLLQPEHVAATLLHPQGWLRTVPLGCATVLLVSRLATVDGEAKAAQIVAAVRRGDTGNCIARMLTAELGA
jgi:probable selenium-dependent hydroxylase accessory protein YqeC